MKLLDVVVLVSATVTVRLSEWKVETSSARVGAGDVVLAVTNAGTIPHQFEIEGWHLERRTRLLQPGQSDTLRLSLAAGRYELYCPVGNGSHQHLGMEADLTVGTGAPAHGRTGARAHRRTGAPASQDVSVVGGGPVVQILPGPFPFADSAAAVIGGRPDDQQADLHHKAQDGPYSNHVARIAGTFRIRAWDFGPVRDSVDGTAELTAQDGARWRVVIDRVQTHDIPFNPRFGGVIMGLYYHGASGVHTPLVPTINSRVALWAWGRLYRNDSLVTDSAMVHVMLLSRTRRLTDFALQCWDCSRQPLEELQLQVTPQPGRSPFNAPGGVLFVNWERSRAQ